MRKFMALLVAGVRCFLGMRVVLACNEVPMSEDKVLSKASYAIWQVGIH